MPISKRSSTINPLIFKSEKVYKIRGIDNSKFEKNKYYITKFIKLSNYSRDPNNPYLFHHVLSPFRHLRCNGKIERKRKVKDMGCHITAIDCGQGDSFLIENKGEYGLIDFGGDQGKVERFLEYHLDKPIKYAVLTHLHTDHMGDFLNIMKKFEINDIFVLNSRKELPPSDEELAKFNNYEYIQADRINFLSTEDIAENKASFEIGNAKFQFISPSSLFQYENDNSLVLLMQYKDKQVMFTGDISSLVEEKIITFCEDNNIDLAKTSIIKVAHHGSKYSSSESFLSQLNSQLLSIISCGQINRYNHPDREAIDRLQRHGNVFRTDQEGNIYLNLKKDREIEITTERQLYKIPKSLKTRKRNTISNQKNTLSHKIDDNFIENEMA